MVNKFIPVNEPLLIGNEKKYLNECINSGWISSEGPFVGKFENKFAKIIGKKYGIAVSSGTAAIEISFATLKLKPGDEVIMPAFTIISCILPIIRTGAIPILIDADPETWNMNVLEVEKKINHKTKAILVSHIYGLPVDMNPILKLKKKYKLKLIEDSAEAQGLKYNNSYCGSFGDLSIFSFYSNKLITSGEGGMILTNDYNLAKECKSIKNLCFNKGEKRFIHNNLGWNYRMTNLQAAVGLAQLERWKLNLKKKIYIGNSYNKLLKNCKNIQTPLSKNKFSKNVYWIYGIDLKDQFRNKLSQVVKKLRKLNIDTRPFFCPMHLQPILKKMGYFKKISLPVSEEIFKNGFYIPCGLSLTDKQIKTVSKSLYKVLNK